MAHHAPKRTPQAQAVRQRAKKRVGTTTMAASLLAVGGLAGLVGVMGHDAAESSTATKSTATTTPAASTNSAGTSQSSTSNSSSSSISSSSSSSTPAATTGGS